VATPTQRSNSVPPRRGTSLRERPRLSAGWQVIVRAPRTGYNPWRSCGTGRCIYRIHTDARHTGRQIARSKLSPILLITSFLIRTDSNLQIQPVHECRHRLTGLRTKPSCQSHIIQAADGQVNRAFCSQIAGRNCVQICFEFIGVSSVCATDINLI